MKPRCSESVNCPPDSRGIVKFGAGVSVLSMIGSSYPFALWNVNSKSGIVFMKRRLEKEKPTDFAVRPLCDNSIYLV